MAAQLNHTIVHAHDKAESAKFLSEVLGLPEPTPFGPFLVVEADNGVSLDFIDTGDYEMQPQHYAFLVSEDEFDVIFGRIQERGLESWADPHRAEPGEINHHFGGRGVYWLDPSDNLLEIITQPYGTEP
jgi:catechol 2,3-dioxygenase-like lactoylglutathione lyase family enzyme